MTKALAILLVLASCKLPQRGSSSASSGSAPQVPEPPRGTPVATLQGFRALASSQPFSGRPPQLPATACGLPTHIHMMTAEIDEAFPNEETIYVTPQGIVAMSGDRVVAATEPVTDCAQLASKIMAAHAGQIFHWGNTTQLVVAELVGTKVRQRLFVHSPQGKLAESFSWIIEDAADPSVKRSMSIGHEGDQLFTETGAFHWDAEGRRYIPGQKMTRSTRKSF